MRHLFALLFAVLALAPLRPALAQDAAALMTALEARTPGAVLKDLRHAPDRFLTEAAGVILGFGGADGLSAPQIEDAIMAERARVRARELRRLLELDLNNDLALQPRELDVAVAASSAVMRGRRVSWHMAADTNDDETVSWPELRAYADLRARSALDARSADAMRALMVFDTDNDARVTLSELKAAVRILGAAT